MLAHSAYGSGDARADLAAAGHETVIKAVLLRPAGSPGRLRHDDATGTGTCPNGLTRPITSSRAVTFGGDCSQWVDPHRRDVCHRHGITRLAAEQTQYRAMPEPCAIRNTDRPVATGQTWGHSIASSRHDEQSPARLTTTTNRLFRSLVALEGGAVSETWPTVLSLHSPDCRFSGAVGGVV